MLPWSVIAIAGWPSATAAATTSSTRAAPSSIEYSVWLCRWANESPFFPVLSLASTTLAHSLSTGFVHSLWTNYKPVISPRAR